MEYVKVLGEDVTSGSAGSMRRPRRVRKRLASSEADEDPPICDANQHDGEHLCDRVVCPGRVLFIRASLDSVRGWEPVEDQLNRFCNFSRHLRRLQRIIQTCCCARRARKCARRESALWHLSLNSRPDGARCQCSPPQKSLRNSAVTASKQRRPAAVCWTDFPKKPTAERALSQRTNGTIASSACFCLPLDRAGSRPKRR